MPRSSRKTLVVLLSSALILPAAFAQTNATRPLSAARAAATPPAPVTTNPPTDEELISVREQLLALLRTTPTLSQVLETDSSLLTDQDYINRTNPQLAQFLTQHPEVTRNPDFYLFANLSAPRGRRVDSLRRRINGNEPPSDVQMQQEMQTRYLGDVMGIVAFVAITGSLLWLIHILLENRRWNRVFHLQSEIHAKLIDRFASNQELLHYMETEPGKRFLEAAPIPVGFDRERVPGGLARILGPLQIGIVLTLLGLGMLVFHPLFIVGIIALALGLGFIISAIVSWRISERLGLLPNRPTPSDDLSNPR